MKNVEIKARGQGRNVKVVKLRSQKELLQFFGNLPLLSEIREKNPSSLYALASATGRDVSNLHKIMKFYQNLGLVELESLTLSGRKQSRPKVIYHRLSLELTSPKPPKRRVYFSVARSR